VPTSNQVVGSASLRHLGDRLDGYVVEYLGRSYAMTARGYLGLPVVLFATYVLVRWRRQPLVRLLGIVTAVAFVASLGPRLKVAGHVTGVRLPGALLTHLPLLQATSPDRYALFVAMGAAALLAIGLDRLHAESPAQMGRGPWRRPGLVTGLLALSCIAALVPVPYSMRTPERPAFLESKVLSAVPAGSVMLTYPFPGPLTAETMEWQANADLRYRIVGGYQFVPDGKGGTTLTAGVGTTQRLLEAIRTGTDAPPVTEALRRDVREELGHWQVRTVVVAKGAPGAAVAVALLSDLLGAAPSLEPDAAVWYDQPFAKGAP